MSRQKGWDSNPQPDHYERSARTAEMDGQRAHAAYHRKLRPQRWSLKMNLEDEVQWMRLRVVALETKASEAQRQIRALSWGVGLLLAIACADVIRIFVG